MAALYLHTLTYKQAAVKESKPKGFIFKTLFPSAKEKIKKKKKNEGKTSTKQKIPPFYFFFRGTPEFPGAWKRRTVENRLLPKVNSRHSAEAKGVGERTLKEETDEENRRFRPYLFIFRFEYGRGKKLGCSPLELSCTFFITEGRHLTRQI